MRRGQRARDRAGGAPAIATTSAGISWTFGRGDGQKLSRDEMIQVIRSIVQTVDVPVTADVEGGYGTGSAQDVAETVRAVIASRLRALSLPPNRCFEAIPVSALFPSR